MELAGGGRSAPERLLASRIDIVIVAGIGRGNGFGGEMRAVMFFRLMRRRLVVDAWGSGLGCCRDASLQLPISNRSFYKFFHTKNPEIIQISKKMALLLGPKKHHKRKCQASILSSKRQNDKKQKRKTEPARGDQIIKNPPQNYFLKANSYLS